MSVRRCRGCGVLLVKAQACTCESETVHVITELGTNLGLPGVREYAFRRREGGPL